MKYEIVTESGSVYQLDTNEKTLHRSPGSEAGELDFDGEPFVYEELLDELTIGNQLRAVWDNKARGKKQIRSTTAMVSIKAV